MRLPIAGCLLTIHLLAAAAESPVAPDSARQTFQVDPGLSLELVAAEPLIASPVAMAWDDAGRLFVVENPGYPTGMPDQSPGGAVATLQDTNGDGRMDHRTVFADDFTFPNGILAWNGGFFVTCAPDIFFLKDTTGDGQADVRQIVLTGFDTRNSTQLRVAHPTLGPDGWVHLTSGLARAGEITSPLFPDRPAVKISTDSRFNPFTYEIEALDGRGQFGLAFDDWGNRFHCMNRVHIQHTVLPSRFLKRNSNLTFNETVQNVPEGMVDDLLKSKNVAARIYPISDNITTADSHAGTFSAACGIHVYRGHALPPDYYGDVFTCDPTGNLVHRDRLTPAGPTFSSRMVNEGREFLASRDNWFRPVFLATGPDGALYVADMYRRTIEHPDYLPEEVRKRTNFDAGRDQGRIWKIHSHLDSPSAPDISPSSPTDKPQGPNSPNPEPSELSTDVLVEDLAHPNVWQRDRAFSRLLAARRTNALSSLLKSLPSIEGPNENEMFRQAQRHSPLDRHDLAAVDRVNRLNAAVALSQWDFRKPHQDQPSNASPELIQQIFPHLMTATVDLSPGVRLAAWRHLREFPSPGLDVAGDLIDVWSRDPNPAVRFQIALALGNWSGSRSSAALIRIALQDGRDKWTRAAFLSGIHKRETHVMDHLLRDPPSSPAPELAHDLGRYFARTQPQSLLAAKIFPEPASSRPETEIAWRIAALGGMIETIGLRDTSTGQPLALSQLGFSSHQQATVAEHARRLIESGQAGSVILQSAATVLAASGPDLSGRLFDLLLQPSTAPALAAHLLNLLLESGQPTHLERLVSRETWSSLSPSLRSSAIENLLRRPDTAGFLLHAIEQEQVQPSALSLAQRDQLKKRVPEDLRDRAGRLFTESGSDRMQVYEQWKKVADRPGDTTNGRALFNQHCAACHRLERDGFNVGPDLFGVRNQPKEAILLHILVPNREVYPGFTAVTIETTDGRSLTGLIRSESDHSITIAQAQGLEETVPRSSIRSLQTGNLSLMPDGFEQILTQPQMADLLAFLKGEP